MGEKVGLDVMYCGVAEDAMEFAGQMNAAAGARNKRLWPKRLPRYPTMKEDADDPRVKAFRAAAQAGDALIHACVRCDLGVVRTDEAGNVCPISEEFAELQRSARSEIGNLAAPRE